MPEEQPLPAGQSRLDWFEKQQREDAEAEIAAKRKAGLIIDDDLNLHCHNLTRSRSGRFVMEYLIRTFLTQPTVDPHLGYDKCVALAFFRDGQNSLIREIQQRADTHRKSLQEG